MRRSIAAVVFLSVLGLTTYLRIDRAGSFAVVVPNPDTCVGYPESRVFIESQGWWVTTGHDGIVDGNDQGNNFGHIHVGTCFPLFKTVSGTVGFDLKLLMHDNPGSLTHIQPFICNNQQNNLCYTAPDVAFNPPLTCAVASCTFYKHIDIDTTQWLYDGQNAFRFRTEVDEPDGNVLRASENWLANIQNGNPTKTFSDGPTYIDAKGWYHGFYSNVKISKGYTPNPSAPFTITFKCGSTNEPVLECLVTVDPDFHATPPNFGTVLLQNALSTTQSVTVTPAQFAVGPHNVVMRSCVHDTKSVPTKDAHRCGVLKLPFATP